MFDVLSNGFIDKSRAIAISFILAYKSSNLLFHKFIFSNKAFNSNNKSH
jgi:hypothetical protein